MFPFSQLHKRTPWRRALYAVAKILLAYIAVVAVFELGAARRSSQQTCVLPNCAPPPSVAIIVPFTEKDFLKVMTAVERWSQLGDPCPSFGSKSSSPSSLHVLFWFNRDLAREPWIGFAQVAARGLAKAVKPVRHCLASVTFDSAALSDKEDPYPFGASNMWYKLYISDTDPLRAYDYFLWAEQDLMPVRKGWMDALVEEVALHQPFFVRGSIYRGVNLDNAVKDPKKAPWVTHINGNAMYTCKDATFRAMVKACYYEQTSDGIHASFDLAIWMNFVSSYMNTWKLYQNYAHKFQYTEFMQNYGYELSQRTLDEILDRSPSTFFIHGDAASAGEQFKKLKAAPPKQAAAPTTTSPCPRGALNCSTTL